MEELCDIVGREGGKPFQTMCSTMRPAYEEQDLFKQWSRLIAMVDTLGLPTCSSLTVQLTYSGQN